MMKYIKNTKGRGCTDNGHQKWSKYPGYPACNYNSQARVNDGSCEYESCFGCTDPQCDETYDINYTIPAQKFEGYGVCEPCSYLSLPRNFYPPIKSNKFASPKDSFLYERGNVAYNKPFGEISFGYVTIQEIRKTINILRNILKNFNNYDLWFYGEIIDNIPARDVKVIVTSKNNSKTNISEINNLMMMCIKSTKTINVCLDIRFHHKKPNGDFYSKSYPLGYNCEISTLVPYNVIKYNGEVIEINNGQKVNGHNNLWSVTKYFPDKNKTNYYKNRKYIDHGVVHLNDKHLDEHLDKYIIDSPNNHLTIESIDFIKKQKPLT